MNPKKKSTIPLIFAHRGASALAPENTLSSFRLAKELEADGIELDVMLSSDKQLVVIHDTTVNRTTNGLGKVPAMTYNELRKLDAGCRFGEQFKGEHLPTLSEVFEVVGKDMIINVELKNYHAPLDDLAVHVVRLIEQFGLQDTTLLSSFNPLNASKARATNPAIPFGLLTEPGWMGGLFRGVVGRAFGYQALHPYSKDANVRMVELLHRQSKQCNVWTVDDPAELLRMRDLGVDAVICNNPSAARAILEG